MKKTNTSKQDLEFESTGIPQIVVALAATREGLPVRSWVFPCNTSDAGTVKKVREDLRGWKLRRALFVADSETNSAANRDELAGACGKYLLASRASSVSEIKDDVLTMPGRFRTIAENLQAREVIVRLNYVFKNLLVFYENTRIVAYYCLRLPYLHSAKDINYRTLPPLIKPFF